MPEIEPEYDRTMNASQQARAAKLTEAQLRTIDECILSNITHQFRKTAKVVALTMGDIGDDFPDLPDIFFRADQTPSRCRPDRGGRKPQPHALQRGAAAKPA